MKAKITVTPPMPVPVVFLINDALYNSSLSLKSRTDQCSWPSSTGTTNALPCPSLSEKPVLVSLTISPLDYLAPHYDDASTWLHQRLIKLGARDIVVPGVLPIR